MSTGIIAAGKVRVAQNKGELVPEGCLIDGQGRPTRDPAALFADPPGALLTLGGHKGYGLSIFCEILAGRADRRRQQPSRQPGRRPRGQQHALDPDRPRAHGRQRGDGGRPRSPDRWVKASPPSSPGGEILLPGEPERRTKARRRAEGSRSMPTRSSSCATAARSVGVPEAEIEPASGPADSSPPL